MPDDFIACWRGSLEECASVIFEHGEPASGLLNPCQIADAFVSQCGFKPIGFNWEMLDPYGTCDDPRSMSGTMIDAIANHMQFPKQSWLGKERALACAADFQNLFDKPACTMLTNRLGDLWNPLTDEQIEWAFIGMDTARVAVLIFTV